VLLVGLEQKQIVFAIRSLQEFRGSLSSDPMRFDLVEDVEYVVAAPGIRTASELLKTPKLEPTTVQV
jgi:hypothetical protein